MNPWFDRIVDAASAAAVREAEAVKVELDVATAELDRQRATQAEMQAALQQLGAFASSVKILGSYPVAVL